MLRIIKNYLKFACAVTLVIGASILIAWIAGISAETYVTSLTASIVWISTTVVDALLTLVKAAYILAGCAAVYYMWFKVRTEYQNLKEAIKTHKAAKDKGSL